MKELADVLRQYTEAYMLAYCSSADGPSMAGVRHMSAAAEWMAAPGSKPHLQRQLEQLAGSEGRQEPLLTAQ